MFGWKRSSRGEMAGELLGMGTAFLAQKAWPAFKNRPKGPTYFDIPHESRFSHMHILAGSGHGKTTFLKYLISEDFESLVQGKA